MDNDVRTYSLSLASERGNIVQVGPFLRTIDVLDELGASRYHDMLVAVTEAVNNAIIHGNGCDPDKTVDIDVRVEGKEVVLLIRDHGEGFDPDTIPDPRHPDRLMHEGGRGVFLIRHLADVVEFYHTHPGTTVLIKYFLP